MSAGRTVENGFLWSNFSNRNATFEARCRCIDDNRTAVSICRDWSGPGCMVDPTVECGANSSELCSPTPPGCRGCTCYPADMTVTGNDMTHDQCVAECAGMNMRMPGNQAELDDARTGCHTNGFPMWVPVCVVGERMENDTCVPCNVTEAETYQNAVAATPQTCGVATCKNGFDPSTDHSACVCEGASKYVNTAGDCAECVAGSAVNAMDITECVCGGTGTSWDAASNTCGSGSATPPPVTSSSPTASPATTSPLATSVSPATPAPPTSSSPTASPAEYSLTCGPDTVENTNRTRCCAVAEGVHVYRDDCTVASCVQTHVWREDSSACVVYTPPESNEIGGILAFLVAVLLLLSVCAALGALFVLRQRRTRAPCHVSISSPSEARQETLHEQPVPLLHQEQRSYSHQRFPTMLPFLRRQERSRSALASVVFYAPQTSVTSDRRKPVSSQPSPSSHDNYDSAYNPYPPITPHDPRRGQQRAPMSQVESLHQLLLQTPSGRSNSNPSVHQLPLDDRFDEDEVSNKHTLLYTMV